MKTQLLLTIEIDDAACRLPHYSHLPPPSPADLAAQLRELLDDWWVCNPLRLQDKTHLNYAVSLAPQRESAPTANQTPRPAIPARRVEKFLVQVDRHPNSRRYADDATICRNLKTLTEAVARTWIDDAKPVITVIPDGSFWHDPDRAS